MFLRSPKVNILVRAGAASPQRPRRPFTDGVISLLAFLKIAGACARPRGGLAEAVGGDALAWCDTPQALDKALAHKGDLRVVAGPLHLDDLLGRPEITKVAFCIPNPVRRCLAAWAEIAATRSHPFHAVPHTFALREVLEEHHPLASAFTNAVSSTLSPAGTIQTPEAILDRLSKHAVLIGAPGRPAAFAKALSTALGVPSNTVDVHAFGQCEISPAQGRINNLLRDRNQTDLALFQKVAALLDERGNVIEFPEPVAKQERSPE